MIAYVPLTVLLFTPCIERAVSRSSRCLSLPLQLPLADPLFYCFATILEEERLIFPNNSAPCRGRGHRSTEKPRGFVCSCVLFSRTGRQAFRNSSRRFFADRILTKPYADWAGDIFSRNFTGFGKERENVSAERRLPQDNALPFSHRLRANFSQFFSQTAIPQSLVFTGFATLFLTISQILRRREDFFETDDWLF